MERMDLYQDIAQRTQGDIYIGVVGPVRTGKSTFIKRFMDLLVLPNIDNGFVRDRVVDELPQSGAGKTIMTTQPKFVPNEAVSLVLGERATLSVRMVDCVGYMVPGALGHMEGDAPRMVRTPWFDHDIPFEDAAELGTRKVISEHSTIALVMTTDGTITELPRSAYVQAEERVIAELKELGKPFVLVLNSTMPACEDAQKLRDAMMLKYDVPVLNLDVLHMSADDINDMLETLLFEFPLKTVHIEVPRWLQALPPDHYLMSDLVGRIQSAMAGLVRVRDYRQVESFFSEDEFFGLPDVNWIRLGEGLVQFTLPVSSQLFYRVLGEQCGCELNDDFQLMKILKELCAAKHEYDRLADALRSVRETGYGLVPPIMDELRLEEPQIVRQGGRYGVRFRASAPSLHFIRVDIESEVAPLMGNERQTEELLDNLLQEFEKDPAMLWKTDIFGKPLHQLIKDGLSNKLYRMPEEAQAKVQETLQRIINESSGGLICILL